MLFDHNSHATFPQQLHLEPEPTSIGCTITEQQPISNQIQWQKENALFASSSVLVDGENRLYACK